MYKMILPNRKEENILKKICRCIWVGRNLQTCETKLLIQRGITGTKVAGQEHWLDKGTDEFGLKFVNDTKVTCNAYLLKTFNMF